MTSQSLKRLQTIILFLALGALTFGLEAWRQVRSSMELGPPTANTDEDDRDDRDPHKEVRSLHPIKLAEPDLGRRLGFETQEVERRLVSRHIKGNAETAYDGRRMIKVYARLPGIVKDLKADPLQKVSRGDIIAVIDSSLVGSAKAQYLTALAAHELASDTMTRMKALTSQEIVPLKNELEARAALNQAKSNLMDAELRLRNLGFSVDDVESLSKTRSTDSLLEVRSPIDGYVTAWDVNIGEAVEPTSQLFALVDTTIMWLWIDLYEEEIAQVKVGQPVQFTISGDTFHVVRGSVSAISTEVNPITRTTRVRASLANEKGRLRANQFGTADIEVARAHEAIVVHASSIQCDGDTTLVFVAKGEDIFEPRLIETLPTEASQWVEVPNGLAVGERVVTTGSFPLYSQLFKDRIVDEVD